MSDRRLLIDHLCICLVIRIAFRPSYIQEKLSQVQVFLVACNAIKTDQTNFYNLVARIDLQFSGAKNFNQQICIFEGNVE
ncbi:hypothetical protein D3C85_1007660 [compost metagenome]